MDIIFKKNQNIQARELIEDSSFYFTKEGNIHASEFIEQDNGDIKIDSNLNCKARRFIELKPIVEPGSFKGYSGSITLEDGRVLNLERYVAPGSMYQDSYDFLITMDDGSSIILFLYDINDEFVQESGFGDIYEDIVSETSQFYIHIYNADPYEMEAEIGWTSADYDQYLRTKCEWCIEMQYNGDSLWTYRAIL